MRDVPEGSIRNWPRRSRHSCAKRAARINGYRARAAEHGLDANRWFRYVEQVSNRATKNYVSNIYKYYMSYREYQRRLEGVDRNKSNAFRDAT